MKMVSLLLVVFSVVVLAHGTPCSAQESSRGAVASSNTSLDQLAWMAGSWAGVKGGVEVEEHWIAPKGGLMLGLHRDLFPSGKAFFEFLRIESSAEGITYWASPGGQPPTPFRLVESSEARVVFENAEHDWPQRIIYWREPDGSLGARAEGEEDGKFRAAEWRWTRAQAASE